MEERLNVLFIAIDTLRADHLGCYGYAKKTSPEIDEIAKDGVLFENAFASAIPTQPSFTTMLTGIHPLRHGIVCHATKAALSPTIRLLPQILKEQGYVTAAVDNLATNYKNVHWFIRGYDYYIDSGGKRVISFGAKVFAERVNKLATTWIRNWQKGQMGDKPFFVFLHYWDPHAPYWPPAEIIERFYDGNPKDPSNKSLERVRRSPSWVLTWKEPFKMGITDTEYVKALYDGEIAHVSARIGELLAFLEDTGLVSNTLVVLTADHGEGMGDNSVFYDHHTLYDFNTHIPLIMKCKSRLPTGQRIDDLVQHTDIVPTILDLVESPKQETLDGTSLVSIMSGKRKGHSGIVCVENTRETKRALRTREWKLIETLRPDFCGYPAGWIELYNLKEDPSEQENLAESEKARAHELLARLQTQTRMMLEENENPLLTQEISIPPIPHPDPKVRAEIAMRRAGLESRLAKMLKPN